MPAVTNSLISTGGNWSNAGIWSAGRVPNSSDTVSLAGNLVNLDVSGGCANMIDAGLTGSVVNLINPNLTFSVSGYVNSTVKSTGGYGQGMITSGAAGAGANISIGQLNASGGGYAVLLQYRYFSYSGVINASGVGTVGVCFYYPGNGPYNLTGSGTATGGAVNWRARGVNNAINTSLTVNGNYSASGSGSAVCSLVPTVAPVKIFGQLIASTGADVFDGFDGSGPTGAVELIDITNGGILDTGSGEIFYTDSISGDSTSTFTNKGLWLHAGPVPSWITNPGQHIQTGPAINQVANGATFGLTPLTGTLAVPRKVCA